MPIPVLPVISVLASILGRRGGSAGVQPYQMQTPKWGMVSEAVMPGARRVWNAETKEYQTADPGTGIQPGQLRVFNRNTSQYENGQEAAPEQTGNGFSKTMGTLGTIADLLSALRGRRSAPVQPYQMRLNR